MHSVLTSVSAKIAANQRLSDDEARELLETTDLIGLGMIADEVSVRKHEGRVTFVRVDERPYDESPQSWDRTQPWGERRFIGAPGSLAAAVAAVERLTHAAADEAWTAFDLADLATLDAPLDEVLHALRAAGLERLAAVSLDRLAEPRTAFESLAAAGLAAPRLVVGRYEDLDLVAAARLAEEATRLCPGVMVWAPLAREEDAHEPPTGYDAVRGVSVARLLTPSLPSIQVSWHQAGAKLSQVSLMFGANDLDCVAIADESPLGPRRAPLEEVRRNIRAASRTAVERSARFEVIV
jgi:hypothetical protein